MKPRRAVRMAVRAVFAACIAAGVATGWAELAAVTDRQALKSDDLTAIRREALSMFPRGSNLDAAAARLGAIGFGCRPLPQYLPDTSLPSLLCASDGRGYPDFPAVNVTLVTRNGMIADIDVWNVMARADGDAEDVDMTPVGSIGPPPTAIRRRR